MTDITVLHNTSYRDRGRSPEGWQPGDLMVPRERRLRSPVHLSRSLARAIRRRCGSGWRSNRGFTGTRPP